MGQLKNLKPCTTCQDCSTTAPCGGPAPVITSAGTASGTNAAAFSYTITATNSPTSYGASGLPAGISVNSSTGVVSGTAYCPGWTMTVSATNGCGTGTKSVVVTITGAGSVLTSPTTATGKKGVFFSFTLTATNSPTSFTASGLPSGLTLNTSSGVISGTPTVFGVFSCPVSASNACGGSSGTLTITLDGDCAAPTLQCDSISASKTKCGFSENTGYVSTPPKIYLSRLWGGGMAQNTYSEDTCDAVDLIETYEVRFSGEVTYSRSTCEASGTNNWAEYRDGVLEDSGTTQSDQMLLYVAFCLDGPCAPTTNSTTIEYVADNLCRSEFPAYKVYAPATPGGNAVQVLSTEYTTADLITDTVNALPAYPGTWTGTCSSYRDLSTDELTYTVRRFKYRFQLPTLTGYSIYNFSWKEGGVTKTYTWNGTDTYTPTYTVSEPASNGSIAITDVTITSCR